MSTCWHSNLWRFRYQSLCSVAHWCTAHLICMAPCWYICTHTFYWRLVNTVTSSVGLPSSFALWPDVIWLRVTYTVSLAFPARRCSSIDGLPDSVCVCVCVCGFAAQPEPSGHLVKRGCFMLKGHTHVRLVLKKTLLPPSCFTPSANTNQSFSHIIPQASLLVLPFPSSVFSPPLYTLIQWRNKWVTVRDKLRQRSEEGEICSRVVEQPISVKGNPPLSQRELHLLCK